MNRVIKFICFTIICLTACSPVQAIKRGISPAQAKPVQHLIVSFINDSASRIRVEMTAIQDSNSGVQQRLPERNWIRAFGKSTYVTGRTNEVLRFVLFLNGKELHQQSFGPFQEKQRKTVRWDGKSLTLEDTAPRSEF